METPCGCEWVVEARGCDPASLTDVESLAALFEHIVAELDLHRIETPVWHRFPVTGGVTGMTILSESHLACHTFPEYGSICLNLFCCVPRAGYDFEGELARRLGAESVQVRRIDRPYHP